MPTKNKFLAFEDYVRGIQGLKPDEQLSLVEIISARLKKILKKGSVKHSIMELEGLGAHIWKGVDVQDYILKERKSWD